MSTKRRLSWIWVAVLALVVSGCSSASLGTPGTPDHQYRVALSMSYSGNDWQGEAANLMKLTAAKDPKITEFKQYISGTQAQNQISRVIRIMEKGQFAGFIILALDPDGKSVEFRRIVVSAKGRGVGQTAISEMEKFCKSELRRERVWLDVFEYNRRGRHIYEKLGYRQYGSIAHESGKLLLLYEKDL